MLPGGFSYGDYLRCGAIARFAPVMGSISDAARGGMPVLGVCNGFQVLCEAHLLPGRPDPQRQPALPQPRPEAADRTSATSWTSEFADGQQLVIPIKHGEGRYVADERTLDELEADGRVVARYMRQPQRLHA